MNSRSNPIVVRSAEPGDARAIDRLIRYVDQFHADARPDLFRPSSANPRGEGFLGSVLDHPERHMLVAARGDEVIGFAYVLIRSTEAANNRYERSYAEIETIGVDPREQGNGVGSMLIESARLWARSKGVHDHQIAVHDFNEKARALYESLGFEPSVTLLRRKD